MVKRRAIVVLDAIITLGVLTFLIALIGLMAETSRRAHQDFERQRDMMCVAESVAWEMDWNQTAREIDSYQVRLHPFESDENWIPIEVIDGKHRYELCDDRWEIETVDAIRHLKLAR